MKAEEIGEDELAEEEANAQMRRSKVDSSRRVLSNLPILGFVLQQIIDFFSRRVEQVYVILMSPPRYVVVGNVVDGRTN